MKNLVKLFLTLGIIIGVFFLIYFRVKGSNVYTNIKFEQMQELLNENDEIYIVVYSDSCVSCRRLEKDIKELEGKSNDFKNIKLYAININNESDNGENVLKEFNIEGVPAIFKYRYGKIEDKLYENIKQEEICDFFNISER